MSEAEAEVEAARRVRDTYPAYSLVGNFVNQLRRFPLAGTFVSFPAEIIRTRYNQLKIAAEDLADPNRRVLGARRLAGLSIAAAIPTRCSLSVKKCSMFQMTKKRQYA